MLQPIVRRSALHFHHQNLVTGHANGIITTANSQCLERLLVSSKRSINSSARRINSLAVQKNKTTFYHHEPEAHLVSKEMRTVDVYNIQPTVKEENNTDDKSRWYSPNFKARVKRVERQFSRMEQKLQRGDPAAYQLIHKAEAPLIAQGSDWLTKFSLTDTAACCEFLSHLGDINAPGTVFVLTHPGAGILSTELLRQGAKKLMLYEPNPELRKHLQVIHCKDLATEENVNSPTQSSVFISDQSSIFDNSVIHTHLNNLMLESPEKVNRVRFIHALTEYNQLQHLIDAYTLNNVQFDKKNVEFYLIATRFIAEKFPSLGQAKGKKISTVLNQLHKLMLSEVVCNLAKESFFPNFAPTAFRNKKAIKTDDAIVLKLTFRPSLSHENRTLAVEERLFFFAFVRYSIQLRRKTVVSSLETWAPGIGKVLINKHRLMVFTTFDQLTHQQFLAVFFTFIDRVPVYSSMWDTIRE